MLKPSMTIPVLAGVAALSVGAAASLLGRPELMADYAARTTPIDHHTVTADTPRGFQPDHIRRTTLTGPVSVLNLSEIAVGDTITFGSEGRRTELRVVEIAKRPAAVDDPATPALLVVTAEQTGHQGRPRLVRFLMADPAASAAAWDETQPL